MARMIEMTTPVGKDLSFKGLRGHEELGRSSERFHREIGEYAGTCKFDALICVGPQAKWVKEAALAAGMSPKRVAYFPDSTAATVKVPGWLRAGDLVLLKGSRGMRLEQIAGAIGGGGGANVTLKSA